MDDALLRKQLREQLESPHAHVTLEAALAGLPREQRGAHPAGQAHSLWRLLEHLRLAQWDILGFSLGPDHRSPKWPEGYWPDGDAPADERAWDDCVAACKQDLAAFVALLQDPARDLFAPFPWGSGQTLLRQALLIADHNAYHLGQIVVLRQLLGSWPPPG